MAHRARDPGGRRDQVSGRQQGRCPGCDGPRGKPKKSEEADEREGEWGAQLVGKVRPLTDKPPDPGLCLTPKQPHQTRVVMPLLPTRELPNPSGPQLGGGRDRSFMVP